MSNTALFNSFFLEAWYADLHSKTTIFQIVLELLCMQFHDLILVECTEYTYISMFKIKFQIFFFMKDFSRF